MNRSKTKRVAQDPRERRKIDEIYLRRASFLASLCKKSKEPKREGGKTFFSFFNLFNKLNHP
jgi:hypothetical protein